MPAISPARLKKEVDDLLEMAPDPLEFERALLDLLDLYADRTYRPAEAEWPLSFQPSNHVPRPVMRRLSAVVGGFAAETPEAALAMAGRLWRRPLLESRTLAARLMTGLPERYASQVLDRLGEWISQTEDERLLEELVRAGVAVDEAGLTASVERFLEREGPGHLRALSVLRALSRSVSEAAIPKIYKLLSPALEKPSPHASARLLSVCRELAERSPIETAFFLRQQYLLSLDEVTGRILRQLLPHFPEKLQSDMRAMLRENR